ncbi:glycosyltransferase family 4 protein [Providencia vermicola]|uniref:glycosyltransferase family 4 protein n=1 Tax=Providencia vermicola TaxID=333965 RepID=UPI0034DDB65D
MSKTIWIVHQYASTPETGMGGRHYYLGSELAKQGYTVYLIASASNHLLRHPPEINTSYQIQTISNNFHFVWVKMPLYDNAHSKQRAINWFLFPLRIQKLAKAITQKPDAILSSSPSPFAFWGARRLANKYTARLIFEVRDIWPLTLTEIGGYSTRNPFIRLMQWTEDKAYYYSSSVVSNLPNSIEHMAQHGMDRKKFSWIPNGFSLDEVNKKTPLNLIACNQLPKNKFIVGYTGTIGIANALDNLLEAAYRLRDNAEISFVLVGDGKEKQTLQRKAQEMNLNNVFFIDPIPKIEIQSMLNLFDVCFIGWLDDPLYKFGIGANKIPEYLYSGKPIIHAYSGSDNPIKEAKAGIQVPANNPQQLVEAILKLYNMTSQERNIMGANGRKAALELYEYSQLSKKLADIAFR